MEPRYWQGRTPHSLVRTCLRRLHSYIKGVKDRSTCDVTNIEGNDTKDNKHDIHRSPMRCDTVCNNCLGMFPSNNKLDRRLREDCKKCLPVPGKSPLAACVPQDQYAKVGDNADDAYVMTTSTTTQAGSGQQPTRRASTTTTATRILMNQVMVMMTTAARTMVRLCLRRQRGIPRMDASTSHDGRAVPYHSCGQKRAPPTRSLADGISLELHFNAAKTQEYQFHGGYTECCYRQRYDYTVPRTDWMMAAMITAVCTMTR